MDKEDDDDSPLELPIQKRPPRLIDKPPAQDDTTSSKPRDPRFDPRCSGSNESRHFLRNYSFIDELKQNELTELERALKREKDRDRKEKIKMAISRYRNKLADNQRKLERGSKQRRSRDEKRSDIVEHYKELKQSGKLSRYLERKRKKILKKDEKSFR